MTIVLSLLAGLALGTFFYGGLWLSVRWLPGSSNPALLTIGSFWVRSMVVVAGFVLLARQGWRYAVIALMAFALGRLVISIILPRRRETAKCT